MAIIRIIGLMLAWICFFLGFVGIFVPVLPTTPLVLLVAFLFAEYSPRCHRWICSTMVYQNYVAAFKQAGGIPLPTKIRILTVSFTVMGISAIIVQRPIVWAVLGGVAIFLLYLMLIRIPTIRQEKVEWVRLAKREDS